MFNVWAKVAQDRSSEFKALGKAVVDQNLPVAQHEPVQLGRWDGGTAYFWQNLPSAADPLVACRDRCANHTPCKSWSYSAYGHECKLTTAVSPPVSMRLDGATGTKIEAEVGFDRPGNDYLNFNLSKASALACETACNEDGKCMAWTYAKPGIVGPQARCFLKNPAPPPTPRSCCVSGVRKVASGSSPIGDL